MTAEIRMDFIRRIGKTPKVPVRTYWCPSCKGWHLTSKSWHL